MKEIGRTDGEVEVILGLVTAVEESWLREMFPEDFSERSGLIFEENGRKVYQVEQKRFRDLVLEEKKRDVEAGSETATVLAQAVLEKKCAWPGWNAEAEGLLGRLEVVRGWAGQEEWPEWDEEAKRLVLELQCEGCLTWRQANERSALESIQAWLGKERMKRLRPRMGLVRRAFKNPTPSSLLSSLSEGIKHFYLWNTGLETHF
jgi:ATP-dependent helicase HrpB